MIKEPMRARDVQDKDKSSKFKSVVNPIMAYTFEVFYKKVRL